MSALIREHTFNSRWWGRPVGIIDDTAFFKLTQPEQETALSEFAWAEFKARADDPTLNHQAMAAAGFFHADTQINYRLGLPCAMKPDSLASLQVEFADETPFFVAADDIQTFKYERYLKLPGATTQKVNKRFVIWSNEQIEQAPSCCLRIKYKGQVEGWYLGDTSSGQGLHLTLAMLSRQSDISGLLLFLKAYEAFANRGHRLGWAAFSVQNTPVHNLYAAIGARFLPPTGCWLWARQ